MRDIKFRIWDGAKNEWLASSDKDALPYYGFALVGEVMTVQSPPIWSLDEGNIVEQFTGLKDKNGTEIYEGDICSFTSKTGKYVGTVEWTGGLAGFGLRMVKNNFLYTFSELDTMGVNLDTLKVIGNIHENPELLEEYGNINQ
nr:MAG TPA: YopX protein [Caudoviricetes sp.]